MNSKDMITRSLYIQKIYITKFLSKYHLVTILFHTTVVTVALNHKRYYLKIMHYFLDTL